MVHAVDREHTSDRFPSGNAAIVNSQGRKPLDYGCAEYASPKRGDSDSLFENLHSVAVNCSRAKGASPPSARRSSFLARRSLFPVDDEARVADYVPT